VSIPQVAITVTQNRTNSEFDQGSIEATQTHAQLAIPGSITEGYYLIRNVGASNVVHVQTGASGTTGRFATLPASGGIALFPLVAAGAVYVVCESGQTSNIAYTILSN
jgi:rhodanese-related sulfurtransferase